MSKERFVESIELIRDATELAHELYACGVDLSDDCVFWKLIDQLVKLLEDGVAPSKSKADLISWFCWDRQFGKENCTIWNDSGIEAELNTAERLYDYLYKED